MIVILSREEFEVDTDRVIDWLDSLGGDWVRLNAEDLMGQGAYAVDFGPAGCRAVLRIGGREVRSEDVRAVWFRRWHRPQDFAEPALEDPRLRSTVEHHLMREMRTLSESIFHLFAGASWLTAPPETRLFKLRALQLASQAGLDVPHTTVVNSKPDLQAFKDRHRRIITKCIGDMDVFRHAGSAWSLYTRELTQEDLDGVPETFFPTLLQERLEKSYEVRSFYLEGRFHSMAIFSQGDRRTIDDFRHYNHELPNRCVPYLLPAETAVALRRFMDSAELTTGSVDLVRTSDERLVFLEVNPGGQFGMVSQPCNYFLEKKVATYLMGLDPTGGPTAETRARPERLIAKVQKSAGLSDRAEPEIRREGGIGALFAGDGGYPLGYPLMGEMDGLGAEKLHVSESDFHRAAVYANYPFYKPISRPFDLGLPMRPTSEAAAHGQPPV